MLSLVSAQQGKIASGLSYLFPHGLLKGQFNHFNHACIEDASFWLMRIPKCARVPSLGTLAPSCYGFAGRCWMN